MSKKQLTAKEAEDIYLKNKEALKLEKVLELIKEESERGQDHLYRVYITLETKKELEDLGYKVSYSNFLQQAWVSWYHGCESFKEQEIRNDEAYVALDENGMITICCPFNKDFAGVTRHAKNIVDLIYREQKADFKEKKGDRLTAKEAKENSELMKGESIKSLNFVLDLIDKKSKEGRFKLDYPCLMTEEDMLELRNLGYDVKNYIDETFGGHRISVSWAK